MSELICKIHFREFLERRTYFSDVSHLSYLKWSLKGIMGIKGIKMSSSDTGGYSIELSKKKEEIPSQVLRQGVQMTDRVDEGKMLMLKLSEAMAVHIQEAVDA